MDSLASPAARALLARLHLSVAAGEVLSGQHNYLDASILSSDRVAALTSCAPVIWGCEWGFSDEKHPTDDVAHRPRLLREMRERHEAGHILVLTWHQASPVVGEPCPFEGGVKTKIDDDAWREVLTPGTRLHGVWCEHVDRLAEGLAQLRDGDVPIVFRPYHEMNGDWFWWGGRPGLEDYTLLWRMLYVRLTERHALHNLLWAWCSDRPWPGVERWWPGGRWVDIVGADIYPLEGRVEVFPQEWYDRLKWMANGRPLALTEHSVLPSADHLRRQPWAWCMGWVDLLFEANKVADIRAFYSAPGVRSLATVS